MKKVMSLRLSEAARKRLAELSVETGQSAGRVVEDLILGEVLTPEKVGRILKNDPPASTVIVSPDPEIERRLVEVRKKKATRSPIQDISATKKVIERPAKPGKPQQGKTTLTGIPFGPVPK